MTDSLGGHPRGRRRFRFLAAISTSAFLIAGLGTAALTLTAESASAANVAINQCNGVGGGGGQTVQCTVSIINTLTDDPATTGSLVSINGGAPVASSDLVTSVTQCNGSANGDGSTIQCSVTIVNNISVNGPAAAQAVAVNQCNANQANDGLGLGTNTCDPYPASTSPATITQCNGTGNGGGLVTVVPVFSHCGASGTVSATLPVTVDQCNGSANGGGERVSCFTSITTNVVDTSATTPTTVSGSSTGSADSGTNGLAGLNGSVAKFTG